MHPEISQLPSEVFYQKKLLDGPAMDEKTKQGWHRSPMFPPYCFFNVGGQEQSAFTGSSLVNRTEAQVAAALYARLQKDFPLVDFSFRVGVVSMYRAQIVELKKVFRERFGMDILEKVDFNTVDGFQGQEKDIIILSCVRASTGGTSVGFLAGELYHASPPMSRFHTHSDVRRMNVALTRARSSLFILGHASTLQRSDDNWKTIVANAKSRSRLVEVGQPRYRRVIEEAHIYCSGFHCVLFTSWTTSCPSYRQHPFDANHEGC
jgi:senataxin